MTTAKRIELPAPLEPYRNVLEKTVRPSVGITVSKGQATTPWQSKFGGHPYLPLGTEHPRDENGQPMMLLAQLNFEEMPPIEPMPKKGILQFYIPFGDDVYGLDFDDQTSQRNFRIVYHPDVVTDESALVTEFGYLDGIDDDMVPFTGEYQLSFQINNEPVSMNDYRFESLAEEADIDMERSVEVEGENLDLWDVCSDALSGNGHKVGGYPAFTQEDPRGYGDRYAQYEILLLQIDTDYDGDGIDIMWGDSGVANFFIREEDLRKLDFSKVLYNWDCC